ncbi:hypothetical protein KHA90_25155, partial [Flavobacterium psychroterrae]|nr:hypothetical protein [Flavobacterium psychroterrae]
VGKPINFLINFRGNKTVYFAPVLPVVSTQKIVLKYYNEKFLVYIDNKLFFYGNSDFTVNESENHIGMLQLAQNDGFDSIEDFCSYFNENYKGKIIHWTDFKY